MSNWWASIYVSNNLVYCLFDLSEMFDLLDIFTIKITILMETISRE